MFLGSFLSNRRSLRPVKLYCTVVTMASNSSSAGAPPALTFQVLAQDGSARTGKLGDIQTPTILMQTSFGSPGFLLRDLQVRTCVRV